MRRISATTFLLIIICSATAYSPNDRRFANKVIYQRLPANKQQLFTTKLEAHRAKSTPITTNGKASVLIQGQQRYKRANNLVKSFPLAQKSQINGPYIKKQLVQSGITKNNQPKYVKANNLQRPLYQQKKFAGKYTRPTQYPTTNVPKQQHRQPNNRFRNYEPNQIRFGANYQQTSQKRLPVQEGSQQCGGFVGKGCREGFQCIYPKGSTMGTCRKIQAQYIPNIKPQNYARPQVSIPEAPLNEMSIHGNGPKIKPNFGSMPTMSYLHPNQQRQAENSVSPDPSMNIAESTQKIEHPVMGENKKVSPEKYMNQDKGDISNLITKEKEVMGENLKAPDSELLYNQQVEHPIMGENKKVSQERYINQDTSDINNLSTKEKVVMNENLKAPHSELLYNQRVVDIMNGWMTGQEDHLPINQMQSSGYVMPNITTHGTVAQDRVGRSYNAQPPTDNRNCDGTPNYHIEGEGYLVTAAKKGCSPMTWNEAVDLCQSKSMVIVSLGHSVDKAHAKRILDIALMHGDAGFWTGGYVTHPDNSRVVNSIVWTSLSGDTELVQQGKNYFSKNSRLANSAGQPDNWEYIRAVESGVSRNHAVKEHCVAATYNHMDEEGVKLHDLACYHKLHVVCEKMKMPKIFMPDLFGY